MNTESEEPQQRERGPRGGCVIVGAMILFLLYALSPPFVSMLAQSMAMTAWGGFFRDLFKIYTPLEYLADQVKWIGDFYNWYFGLFGVP